VGENAKTILYKPKTNCVNGAQFGYKPKSFCERKINRKIRFEHKWGKDLLGLSAEALSSAIIGLLRAPLRFGWQCGEPPSTARHIAN
jgi:hypothetical protein